MVTILMVKQRLNVTNMQLEMALYSGRLPKPTHSVNEMSAWDDAHIEPFIAFWEQSINKRKELLK